MRESIGRIGGGPGVQLRPRRPREGFGLDVLVVAVATAVVAAVVVVLLMLFVAPGASGARIAGGSGGAAGPAVVDLPVDRVLTRMQDGRQSLSSFTLRMHESEAPSALASAAASRDAVPLDEYGRPRRRTPTPNPAESALRDRIATAISGLSYDDVAGEAGKDRLRQTVLRAANEALPSQPVTQVYIRELIVQ